MKTHHAVKGHLRFPPPVTVTKTKGFLLSDEKIWNDTRPACCPSVTVPKTATCQIRASLSQRPYCDIIVVLVVL